jgi:hypothetical protein
MNAATHVLRRPAPRIAELDPFAVEPDVDPGAGYGCVDWFAYGPKEPAADAPAPKAQPRIGTAGLLRVLPPEPPARRH